MRLKAFAGPFGVCYQVVTRTTWQLVAESGSHLNSISSQTAAAAVAPSRATTRCPASLLASRRTYTALYRIYPHQRASRYKNITANSIYLYQKGASLEARFAGATSYVAHASFREAAARQLAIASEGMSGRR